MTQQAATTAQNQAPTNPIDKMCVSLTSDTFLAKLQQALPPNIGAEKFARTTINAIQMHPQQNKFKDCDTRTLFVSCQKAAADGLMLDGREATLVAYYNKNKKTNDISYVPMVQGLVKVARNSGEISSIDAHVVYETDSFKFRPGFDAQPVFEPDWKTPPSQRGEPVLAYCVVHLKDGTIIAPEPMHSERIMQIARGGNNPDQYDPKKGPHWTEWWKKTVIKNALKYAPKSSELLALEKSDNDAQGFRDIRDITPGKADDGDSINALFNSGSGHQLAHQEASQNAEFGVTEQGEYMPAQQTEQSEPAPSAEGMFNQ